MVLHLESIWLIGALTAFTYGLLMLVVRPAYTQYFSRTLLFTAISGLSLGVGFLLRSGIPPLAESWRLMAANTLVPLGLGYGYRAIAEMKRRPCSRLWLYIPPAMALASAAWFTSIQRNVTICQLLYNVENAALLLSIAVLLQRPGKGRIPGIDRLAAAAFLLPALSTFVVVALFVAGGSYPVEYNFSQPLAVYNVIVTITFASLIYFILLLMIFERLNEELKAQALRDPLTGVYNRRAFEEIAFREISGAKRSGLPLVLIVCDIDHFKAVNDGWGHLAGDQVLVEVADLLRANLRDEDTLCRWGGDEFVALLPRAGADDAAEVAERIQKAFQNGGISAAGAEIPVSLSVGFSAGDRVNGDLSSLLDEADQAMYRAKERFKQLPMSGGPSAVFPQA